MTSLTQRSWYANLLQPECKLKMSFFGIFGGVYDYSVYFLDKVIKFDLLHCNYVPNNGRQAHFNVKLHFFEPTCVHARWAHMHRFASVGKKTRIKFTRH